MEVITIITIGGDLDSLNQTSLTENTLLLLNNLAPGSGIGSEDVALSFAAGSVRVTAAIRTRDEVVASQVATALNSSSPAELSVALAVPVTEVEQVSSRVNGEALSLTMLQQRVAVLERTILLLRVALVVLGAGALIICTAAAFMQHKRRRLARKAAELGTKRTLEGLAKRNAAEVQIQNQMAPVQVQRA